MKDASFVSENGSRNWLPFLILCAFRGEALGFAVFQSALISVNLR
jgi:hypothetical protein